jgi:hypothetical protein
MVRMLSYKLNEDHLFQDIHIQILEYLIMECKLFNRLVLGLQQQDIHILLFVYQLLEYRKFSIIYLIHIIILYILQ